MKDSLQALKPRDRREKGRRAPAKLPAPKNFLAFLDTRHLIPSSDEAAKAKPRNRAVAKRLLEIGGSGNDAPSRIARCLAFSFTDRGYGTFHMLRFVCGLELCFLDPFAFEGLGEEFGLVLGPCVRSREELSGYLAYFMQTGEFDAAEIARTAWHGTRAVGLFANATYKDSSRSRKRGALAPGRSKR